VPENWATICEELNLVSIHCDHRYLTAERARQISSNGQDLYCYTVNDRDQADALWAMGVDGIITDNPLLMAKRDHVDR